MDNENKIILDGVSLTQEEFNQKKVELEKRKGVLLIEVKPNEYRTKIQG